MASAREVLIEPGEEGSPVLRGDLTQVPSPRGIVVFAHGSGSSRRSPRNRWVAERLNEAGLATLLFDLLTPEEAEDRRRVFDIPLLARRLIEASAWIGDHATEHAIGYFGASTGAAAALWAAADDPHQIGAVVSRGGRPDLAGPKLGEVQAPTLLIVGGADPDVLELNHQARSRLGCPNQLEVIPGAGHLFEEPGALERVAELAADWFSRHLAR
jgi:putative phosphoribosyl transferase